MWEVCDAASISIASPRTNTARGADVGTVGYLTTYQVRETTPSPIVPSPGAMRRLCPPTNHLNRRRYLYCRCCLCHSLPALQPSKSCPWLDLTCQRHTRATAQHQGVFRTPARVRKDGGWLGAAG